MQTEAALATTTAGTINRPRCETCGAKMFLARVDPLETGYDLRQFECVNCGEEKRIVVRFR